MNPRLDVQGFLDKLDAALRGYREVHGSLDNIEDIVDQIGTSLFHSAATSVADACGDLFSEFGFVEDGDKIIMAHENCQRGAEVNGFPFLLIEATEAAYAHDMTCEGEKDS